MAWSISLFSRGVQLAWLGTVLAFENRRLYKHDYVKTFLWLLLFAFVLWFLLEIVLWLPLQIVRYAYIIVRSSLLRKESEHVSYSNWVTDWVANFPLYGLLFIRYVYPEPLDSLFLDSLRQVDYMYIKKHEGEKDLRPPYAPALERYDATVNYWLEMRNFAVRSFITIRNAMLVYFASMVPIVGDLVYPVASAYMLIKSLGPIPATVVGVFMYVTPGTKPYAVLFLETLNATRTLTRELLEPFFSRIKFSPEQRRKWFRSREALLFGFSLAFYPLVRLPWVGMLFFGVAQAAAALLLVKVTTPPPPPGEDIAAYKIDYKYRDPRKKKAEKKEDDRAFAQLREHASS